eukprot:Em0013g910a
MTQMCCLDTRRSTAVWQSVSKCNQVVTLRQFFEDITWSRPSKVGFIGGGCDDSTIKTAGISYFFNLTQVTIKWWLGLDTSEGSQCALCPGLGTSCWKPVIEHTYGSRWNSQQTGSAQQGDPIGPMLFAPVLQKLVATIDADEECLHLSLQTWCLNSGLLAAEKSANVKVLLSALVEVAATLNRLESLEQLVPHHNITSVSYSSDPRATTTLDAILSNGQAFNTESRIIYLAMYMDDTIPVLCEAYHQNKVYPLYVFITLGWYPDGWWDSSTVNCTRHQMEIALNRSLAITLDPQINDTDIITSSGLYRKLYLEGVSRLNLSDVYEGDHGLIAVWSYAIALNRTIRDLRSDPAFNRLAAAASHLPPNSTFYMENFTYANDVILERMYQHLMNASFVGITLQKFDIGYVALDQNGQSVAFDFLPGQSIKTIWPDGVPHDGTLIKSTINIELGVTAVMYILATLGIALAIICFIIMIAFRERKLIRLTSPNINYITCGGCMVLYTSIFFLAIQSTDETTATAICNVQIWLWAIGYSVAFGPILGKMYRVYYIFNNPKPNKKRVIKDWMIGVLISVLAGIDVIILVIVTAVPELRTTAVLKQSTEYPQIVSGIFHVTTINCIFICDSQKGYTIWHGVLFGYKGLIQVVAILLAFGTRNVKVKGLNDSRHIAAIIYVTSICLVVVIISFATLRDKVNTLAVIYSLGFWCAATIILLLVFIPKNRRGSSVLHRNNFKSCMPNQNTVAAALSLCKNPSEKYVYSVYMCWYRNKVKIDKALVEIQIQNHDDKIVKISLDKGEVDDDLENRVVVLQEEKVPGRGNKSISTQLKQQVKDLPRLEFELACPQNKEEKVPRRGKKSVSTQLKQQVKDLPRLEFELACPQNKEEKVPRRGKKSVSTQLKQQVKDSPPLEFEGACAQRKVMSVPEDDEDAATKLTISNKSIQADNVIAQVNFTGFVHHATGEKQARKISSSVRSQLKQHFQSTHVAPSKEYHKQLKMLASEQYAAGNRDGVGCSSSVMRKISSEARLALRFDEDLIASLLLLRNCIIKSENESIAKPRVVKGFIQHIHASPFSVICFNEASSLRRAESQLYNSSNLTIPPQVIIDRSQVLLISFLNVYNMESIEEYLHRTFRISCDELCKKGYKKVMLYCSKMESKQMKSTYNSLADFINSLDKDCFQEQSVESEDHDHEDNRDELHPTQHPFGAYFSKKVDNITLSDQGSVHNEYYNPEYFDILMKNWFSMAPFWSALMLGSSHRQHKLLTVLLFIPLKSAVMVLKNTHKFGSVIDVGRKQNKGLENASFVCLLNAAIQALLTTPLHTMLEAMKPLNSTRIQNAFLCLCNELEGNQNHPCDSSDLAHAISAEMGTLKHGLQNDCCEGIIGLLKLLTQTKENATIAIYTALMASVLLDKCNSSIPPPYLLNFTELEYTGLTIHLESELKMKGAKPHSRFQLEKCNLMSLMAGEWIDSKRSSCVSITIDDSHSGIQDDTAEHGQSDCDDMEIDQTDQLGDDGDMDDEDDADESDEERTADPNFLVPTYENEPDPNDIFGLKWGKNNAHLKGNLSEKL